MFVLPPHYSRKKNNASVRHCERQAQDAAAHDGIAQVEDGHPEGGMAGVLLRQKKKGGKRNLYEANCSLIAEKQFKSIFEIKSVSDD